MNKALEHDDVTIIDGDTFEYQESDQSKAFEDFRQAFDQEQMGTLRVHRIPVTNRTTQAQKMRTVYLFSCPIDAFTFEELLEHIKDNYLKVSDRGVDLEVFVDIPKCSHHDMYGLPDGC